MIEIKSSENKGLDLYIEELEEKSKLYVNEQLNGLFQDMENIVNVIKALRKNNK